MNVRVLYFASCRDASGKRQETVELPDGSSARELMKLLVELHPELSAMEPNVALAVNQEYAGKDAPLADGDEVALIPPVSGGAGAGPAGTYEVVERHIGFEEAAGLVRRDTCGAVACFGGVVRARSGGRRVLWLEYEAYVPMAERVMAQIGREIAEQWPVEAVAILHRVGKLQVGETSVAIAVAAPHRREALEACAYAIDRLKEIAPIWKKEAFEDGEVWVGHHGGCGTGS